MALEAVRFIGDDGTQLVLTNYTTVFLQTRRGWAAPPVDPSVQSMPGVPGGLYTGSRTRERKLSFVLLLAANDWQAGLAVQESVVNTLAQNGILESQRSTGITRRLKVQFAGGLDGDSAARQGSWLKIIPEYVAADPYWYNPVQQIGDLDTVALGAGMSFPRAYPLYWSIAGASCGAAVTTDGNVPAPWILEAAGPFTRLTFRHLSSQAVLDITYTVGSGETLIIDTSLGEHRLVLDRPSGRKEVTTGLSALSNFWALQPGLNRVAIKFYNGNGASRATLRWNDRYRTQ